MRHVPGFIAAVFFASLALQTALCAADSVAPVGQPLLPVREEVLQAAGNTVAFSPDGRLLLTDDSMDARIWDAETFKPVGKAIAGDWHIRDVRFVGDGSLVLVSYFRKIGDPWCLRYFRADSGTPVGPDFSLGADGVLSATSGDGEYFAVGFDRSSDGVAKSEIKVFDRRTRREVLSDTVPHALVGIWVNWDASALLYEEGLERDSTGRDRAIHLLRLHDHKILFEDTVDVFLLEHAAVAFSPDGRSVAIGGQTGFKLFDVATEKLIADASASEPPPEPGEMIHPWDMTFSSDGMFLLAWEWRRHALRRWDIGAIGHRSPIFVSNYSINHCTFSRDCRRVACTYVAVGDRGTEGNGLAVMDTITGVPIWKYAFVPEFPGGRISLSPDGRHVAVSDSAAKRVYILDLNDLPAASASRPATTPAVR